MNYKLTFILVFLTTIIFSSQNVFASSEPILITASPHMEQVIFDGKWTFTQEWKKTSLTTIAVEDEQIIIRTAHSGNFIYVLVNFITDQTLDKGADKATICFDGQNNKNKIPDQNDYCFSSTLGHKEGIVFQGGSITALTGNFQKISNPDGFVAISSVSDENDRYTKIPHPSFEFKIPIDLLQRSDNYGFFVSVYDANSDTFYSFPKETVRENLFQLPSPSHWGDIVSPDKSLPELNLPVLVLSILFFTVILVQSRGKIGIFRP